MRHNETFGVMVLKWYTKGYEETRDKLKQFESWPAELVRVTFPDMGNVVLTASTLSCIWRQLEPWLYFRSEKEPQRCYMHGEDEPVELTYLCFCSADGVLSGHQRCHLFAHFALGYLKVCKERRRIVLDNVQEVSERVMKDVDGNLVVVFGGEFRFPDFTTEISRLWNDFNLIIHGQITDYPTPKDVLETDRGQSTARYPERDGQKNNSHLAMMST